jgi:carotenoid cleavage dioxygenase-like enzyme
MQYMKKVAVQDGAYPPLEFLPASNVVRISLDLNTKQTTVVTLDKRNGEFAAVHPERVGHNALYIYTASCQVGWV